MENCIIDHEIMCYPNSKKGKKGYMTIKVDMTKAYDMVEWDILVTILRTHDFSNSFSDLICKYLSSVHYLILVNGPPYDFFLSTRGIRGSNITCTIHFDG